MGSRLNEYLEAIKDNKVGKFPAKMKMKGAWMHDALVLADGHFNMDASYPKNIMEKVEEAGQRLKHCGANFFFDDKTRITKQYRKQILSEIEKYNHFYLIEDEDAAYESYFGTLNPIESFFDLPNCHVTTKRNRILLKQ